MINIDLQRARARLLPETGWRPWQQPDPPLAIDEWVARQRFERGILPPHIEQDGCPYWYVRRAIVTAVAIADQQEKQAQTKQPDLQFKTKPEYIRTRLEKYAMEAVAIAEAAEALSEQLSHFWHLHLSIDGRLYTLDHIKVADVTAKPDIDGDDRLRLMRELACLPDTLKLKEIADAATAALQVWLNNQGNVWKHIFVSHLGLVWRDLTKKSPTNSDPFKGFIADALASLEGGPDESFDRAIRTVARGFRDR